jgi:hypothetical protein
MSGTPYWFLLDPFSNGNYLCLLVGPSGVPAIGLNHFEPGVTLQRLVEQSRTHLSFSSR